MKLTKVILLLGVLLPTLIFGQKEANNWYFGENAGLRFNDDGTVIALTDGQLNTYEGCASISSPDGNLLFYTDGQTVYNRNHNIMPNADGTADDPNPYAPLASLNGLYGGESSTQSAIIIPWPQDPNRYIIFTTRTKTLEIPGPGLNYSVVDMTLNGGLGDVTTKNVNLLPNCAEKITAVVKDCRSESFWVVTLGTDGSPGTRPFNTYHAFEITSTGVNPNSVTSNSPALNITRNGVGGYLKFSPDGTKLASANMTEGLFIYDFNSNTGVISNERRLYMSGSDLYSYGVEFSPNSRYLYTTANNDTARTSTLFQFDTQSIDIVNSRTIVDRSRNFTRGALQLGPNGKIYRALPATYLGGGPYLGVINNPDVAGIGANYQHNAVVLDGRFGYQGLPPFVQSFFNRVDLIPDDIGRVVADYQVCEGDPLMLETQYIPGATYEWRNGNGDVVTDGDADQHIHNIIAATLADAGNYTVTITKPNAQACPITGTLEVIVLPLPSTSSDVLFVCDSDANTSDGITNIDLTQLEDTTNFTYTYYESIADRDADTNAITDPTNYTNTSANQTIYYNAQAIATTCSNSAELQLEVGTISPFSLDTSYFICAGNPTVSINGPTGYDSYQWIRLSDGQIISTASATDISDIGDYRLETSMDYSIAGNNYSCTTSFDFNVLQSTLGSVSLTANGTTPLGGSFTICQNQTLTLAATDIPGGIYQWRKDGIILGNTENSYQISTTAATDAGDYEVTVTDPAAASCPVTATLTLVVDATITNSVITMQTCDTDMDDSSDGITNIDLTTIEDPALTYTYFETEANRTAGTAITDPNNYRNINSPFNPVVYFSTTNSLGCEDFGEIRITVNTVAPLTLETNYWICPESPSVTISAPNGYASYRWFRITAGTPQLASNDQNFTTTDVGEYVLEVSSDFTIPTETISCSSRTTLNVLASSLNSVDLIPNGTPVENDFTLCEGEPLTLETQEIPGATYIWEKDNIALNNSAGHILQIDAMTAVDAGNYSVTVTPADALTCPITGTLSISYEPILPIADALILTCDLDIDNRTDGITTIDLTQIEDNPSFSYNYYQSVANRDANLAISDPENYRNRNAFNETIYVKGTNSLGCESLFELQIEVNNAPEIVLEDNYWLCPANPSVNIMGTDGFDSYQWFRLDNDSEELISSEQEVTIAEIGEYMLEVGYDFANENETVRCTNIFVFGVLPSVSPVISEILVEGENNINSVEVVVTEEGDFEFSLDGVSFQESNIFENVPPGLITVYVQDKNGCGVVEETIEIEIDLDAFGFPKFFTPNGDGINDFWQFVPPPPELDLEEIDIEIISIFNRYGNLIVQLNPNSRGWDGNFQGTPLPSSDYWFKARIAGNNEIRGHFTLKR